MSYAEFIEWRLFNNVWPIGERRQDMNFAQMCSVMAAQFSTKPIPMKDFLMFEDVGLEKQDEQLEASNKGGVDMSISDEDLSPFGGNVRRISRK